MVDLDNREEEPPEDFSQVRGGEDVFAMLAANAGAAMPADTYAVATPSGRHLYYRTPGGDHTVRNSAGSLGWHVDIRAAGGYVVAAGSLASERPEPSSDDALSTYTVERVNEYEKAITKDPSNSCSTIRSTVDS